MRSRSVGTSGRGNMRNGLISLLTVVVIISLATAAVLTVATAHAMSALSERQANMTDEGYQAEQAAQTFVAELDEQLHAARTAGNVNASALMSTLESNANSMLAKACPQGITATYDVKDMTLTCEFTTQSGRMLQVGILIGTDATYDVASWKLMAMPQDEDTGYTLWVGPTAGE